ncbi:gliding motility-associated ABC transporter permease subunit GldF [Marinifilum caeruleilacunae]|uniref:Gliding motility-associated ABC transporter permease subunit GldF n=1 Tax=Marinifilum caeruleilacunae TaxID=2499076 RepID=A0ABX1WTP9_9BACT|nr:gliding motility-associated ABC transporter permease subunit GldF [Marinifilum caeruleilacunae]NOU59485.1 gliding motility-associated ABC transporter permease subunit GldF [Marinifilum caeruleilacunae]
MLALLTKEFRSFFSSLTGYLILSVFLIATGLFVWVFPGSNNPLDSGYANLNVLFEMSPWIYLFLIPAVCMRLFADEKKQGTIELVYTRPIKEGEIVLAKYFAALLVIAVSLLFCLVYYFSVYYLGSPAGSIDSGAFWGSIIGLFLLAAVYVAIGVFSSSVTDNQIVAFLLAVVLCFLIYIGFDYLAELNLFQNMQSDIYNLGIQEHYKSISRGVLDSRDLIYFIGVIVAFLLITRTVLKSRKW